MLVIRSVTKLLILIIPKKGLGKIDVIGSIVYRHTKESCLFVTI